MTQRKICKVEGCRARAWERDYCNRHALERYRSRTARSRPTEERLAEGRRLLRKRARELGIILANDAPAESGVSSPAAAELSVVAARGKIRSPVG